MSKPVIAIDMGGTKIKIGLVQEETVLSYISIDADPKRDLLQSYLSYENHRNHVSST
jgi:glucokinase